MAEAEAKIGHALHEAVRSGHREIVNDLVESRVHRLMPRARWVALLSMVPTFLWERRDVADAVGHRG